MCMFFPSAEMELRSKGEVYRVFDRIAGRYDLTNTLLSFGRDRCWRRSLVKGVAELLGGVGSFVLLDLATGTGEVVREFRRRIGENGVLVGVDMSEGMLYVAREKWRYLSGQNCILVMDAMRMGVGDGVVDAVTVAFGVRNFADVRGALSEVWRVLRRGGVVGILEFGLPEWWIWRNVYLVYLDYVMPGLGWILTGDGGAYRYLRDTIRGFPTRGSFVRLMEEVGFVDCRYEEYLGGVVLLYLARKGEN